MRTALLCALWVFLLALAPSCGYRPVPSRLPDGLTKVYVKPFENASTELLLGAWITEELRREFARGGGILLSGPEDADLVVEGRVAEVLTSGLSYARYDQAVERRILVRLEARLLRPGDGSVLWKTDGLVREEAFLVGRTVEETERLKTAALRKLARDVAEILFHRAVEAASSGG